MRKAALTTMIAIFIALCLSLWAVYGQERRGMEPQQPFANMIRLLMRLMDLNSDGKISEEEYSRFFADADQDKDGSIVQKEVMELMSRKRQRKSKPEKRAETLDMGQEAPDFTLKTLDGKKNVTLSHFKGKKPVVLVFGSYT